MCENLVILIDMYYCVVCKKNMIYLISHRIFYILYRYFITGVKYV